MLQIGYNQEAISRWWLPTWVGDVGDEGLEAAVLGVRVRGGGAGGGGGAGRGRGPRRVVVGERGRGGVVGGAGQLAGHGSQCPSVFTLSQYPTHTTHTDIDTTDIQWV